MNGDGGAKGAGTSGGDESLQVFIDGGANGQTNSCGSSEGGHNRRNASHQAYPPRKSEDIPVN